MIGSLLAYDADGNVIATLGHMVARNERGDVIGLIDFGAHEAANGEHTDIWMVPGAKGSKVWPEFLGTRAHEFRAELEGPPGQRRLSALVHKESSHRRERAAIEAAIAAVPLEDYGRKDLRHIRHVPSGSRSVQSAVKALAPGFAPRLLREPSLNPGAPTRVTGC